MTHHHPFKARLAVGASLGLIAALITVQDAGTDATAAADAPAASTASAAPANPDAATADFGTRVSELTVYAQKDTVVAVAPVSAPLQSTTTSIVSRRTIDLLVPQTGDYTQAILLTPSISGISQNGAGFYEAKSTLRGFSDGHRGLLHRGGAVFAGDKGKTLEEIEKHFEGV